MAKNIREIISLQHELVKHLVHVRQNRDYREDHGTVLIEGKKLISEIPASMHVKTVMASDPVLFPTHLNADDYVVTTEEILQKVSGLKTSEGIVAEVKMPPPSDLKGKRRILACDQINDPGNLGTLLRTALALGWEGVYLLNNCCDVYNEKALRAAKGATFKIPLAQGSWTELNTLIENNKLVSLVADMHGTAVNELPKQERLLLILGNEASGASEESLKRSQRVTIPISNQMESLNVAVAGGILMYFLGMTQK